VQTASFRYGLAALALIHPSGPGCAALESMTAWKSKVHDDQLPRAPQAVGTARLKHPTTTSRNNLEVSVVIDYTTCCRRPVVGVRH
jgi:hypothetical protein